jgi:uncharacterized protein YdaU (DUF1376 family)
MPIDLTRFDFHVVRFMNSESVKRMTAEEVGQYILLLCDAWLIGKEASLPDDPAYLARTARCQKVSPLVLSKFPIVPMECGKRRQNEPLYQEWVAATKRSRAAREKAASKWSASPIDYAARDRDGDTKNKRLRSERMTAARSKGTHTAEEWLIVLEICNNVCAKCGSGEAVVKDHIKPIYQGGSDGIENIQPLCRKCNSSKGSDGTDFRPQNWREKMPAIAAVRGVLLQPENAYPYQPKPIRSKSDQGISKEEIQKAFAADDEKTARENAEFIANKKKQDEFLEATRGQI